MKKIEAFLVGPKQSLRDVLQVLDANGLHISLVVDEENHLLGSITDGDIRRAIIAGKDLSARAESMMNRTPHTMPFGSSKEQILSYMSQHEISQMPIINNDNKVIGIETIETIAHHKMNDNPNWIVIMAGGQGKRLRPLTEKIPKPLLSVGDKPILERILLNCHAQNFKKFYISVNYKAEMIKEYFGNGKKFGVQIIYLEEKEALGTAGSLSLIPEKPVVPIIVMNADLLTDINLNNLLALHKSQHSTATMAVREYDMQIPYGVIKTENNEITSIEEKPIHQFFVNAGVYAINAETLKLIPEHAYLDMPDLFNNVIAEGHKTAAFPITAQWIDIGQMKDYKRANDLL